jgi:hypothetical protein
VRRHRNVRGPLVCARGATNFIKLFHPSHLRTDMRTLVTAAALMLLAGPAAAQVELSGEWAARQHEDAPERGGGPDVGEYQGLPINEAARFRADAWSASLWTVPEHQCIPHPADYGPNFSGVRIWKDIDPVTQEVLAYHTNIAWMNPVRTIWMDGRPHPPANALHTWEGFSTGRWEGDMLTVETTHLKAGYIRRNGLARSEKATLREHFLRVGDVLTWISIVTDPVYLTEPFIKSRNFYLDPGYQVTLYPCSTDVEVPRAEGDIPHYLPGTNPYLSEFAMKHALPREAVRGGAETMYPEYEQKLKGAGR